MNLITLAIKDGNEVKNILYNADFVLYITPSIVDPNNSCIHSVGDGGDCIIAFGTPDELKQVLTKNNSPVIGSPKGIMDKIKTFEDNVNKQDKLNF